MKFPNMNIKSVVAGILVTILLDNVQCALVTKPDNAAARVGDIVVMNCSSTFVDETCGRIRWKHFIVNSAEGDLMNRDDQMSPSVTSNTSIANSNQGNCVLRIAAAKSAAGRYQCDDLTSGDASAELIVLEKDPKVEICKTFSSNTADLRCSVNYTGNWAPEMQWTKIVGDRWTNVTATEGETSKSSVSRLIKIPLATFDPTGATEHFVCNITISQPGGSNMPIYAWQSKKSDTTWEKAAEEELTTGHVPKSTTTPVPKPPCEDRFGFGILIGFIICFFITTCPCIGVIIYLICYKKKT